MTVATLLQRLDRVRKTGPDRWVASCPTRDDRHPSLTIRELDDGRVLIHDFGGDSVHEILAAVGLELSELFPPRPLTAGRKPERRPFNPYDVLKIMAFEAGVAALCAADLLRGHSPSDDEVRRLLTAYERLQTAVEVANG